MAVPAAVLSVLVQANTGGATRGLMRFNSQLGGTETKANKATRALGTFAKVGVIGAGIGLGYAVKKAADFEQQMDSLGSVSGATGREMEKFRKQAMKAGADTKFSALDAAEAQTELAKGGLKVRQIMRGGLKSALALAAAGEMDLGEAAATTANALNLFGLEGKNSMKVADALAKAANATTADVTDFAMALRQSGGVAKTAGLSFSETVLALEALANAGTKNSDAGTSLKTALIQLIKPTEKQAALADKLNLSFLDAGGNFKNLADVSVMLRDRLGGMTAAQRTATLATLAGTDGVRTLTALYDAGPKKLDKWKKGLNESGTAAEVAARKQSNLKGKLENLQGSIETIAIAVGMKLIPQLTKYAERLTDILNNTKLSGSEKVGKVAELLAEAIGKGIAEAGKAAAHAAPHVASAFIRAFMDADAWGKLAIGGAGAFLLKKLGVGAGIGKLLGGGGGLTGGVLKSTKPIPVFVTNPGGVGGGTAAGGVGAKGGAAAAAAGVGAAIGPALAGAIAAEVGHELRKELDKQTKNLPGGKALTGTRNFIGRNIPAGMPGGPFLQSVFGNKPKPEKLKGGVGDTFKGLATATGDAQKLIKATQHVRRAFGEMRSGTVTDVRQISKIASNNFRKIREDIGLNTKEGRQAAERNFQALSTAVAKSMNKGKTSTSAGMSVIEKQIKIHSREGKEGLSRNFTQAIDAVKTQMRRGGRVTAEGLQVIKGLMVSELKAYGISGKEALKIVKQGGTRDDNFRQAGHQRGGPINQGAASGDTVPAMLERGEYVMNRKAVKKVGRKALDQINFSAAPRFQKGGFAGMVSAANQVDKAGFPYSWGGGHSATPAPFGPFDCSGAVSYVLQKGGVKIPTMVSGSMMGIGKAGPGQVTVYANPGHVFMSILGRFFGTSGSNPGGGAGWFEDPGESYKSGFTKRHFGTDDIGAVMGAMGTIPQVKVGGPDSLLKSTVQGALDLSRAGANKKLSEMSAPIGSGDAGDPGPFTGGGNATQNRALGLKMAKARGWGGANWRALDYLWGVGESAWDEDAMNPSSGAYGIAQALPSSKYPPAGQPSAPDGGAKAQAQIKWGLDYIAGRYTDPSGALAAWKARSPHWYAKGGMIDKLAYAGDSLGVGTLGAGLKGKLGKIDLASNAVGGKPSPWGVGAIKPLLQGAGAAMFDLGTNDGTAGNLRPSISAVKKMLKDRPLMMASLDPQSTDVGKKNAAIRSMADVVVPWADMAQKYASDAVHPTGAGYSKRASMIAQAAKKIRSGEEGATGVSDKEKKQLKTPLKGSLGKVLTKTLKVLRSNKPAKFRGTRLKQLEKKISGMGVGLPDGMKKQINMLRAGIEETGEYADRASSLNIDNEDGTTGLGVVKGKTEAGWVTDQLDMLFRLRNKLVDAKQTLEKHRAEIQKLIDRMQERLKAVAKQIRHNAEARNATEKELKQLQKHPKQNKKRIAHVKATLGRFDTEQKDLVRERTAISDKILPALTGKRKQFTSFINESIMGSDGLPQVQGLGSPLERLQALPAVGVLGGDIFEAQMRLRELAAPASSTTDGSSAETSESAELLKELLREANLRTAVSQKQYEVFKNFPAYGGEFATGGVVPGPIGAARTIVAHGGETVTPPGNGGGANVQINFGPGMDWLEKFIEVKVDGVTRKQARGAARSLPGRGGGI